MSKQLLPSEKEVLLWQDKSEKAVLARLGRHYRDAMKDIEMKISSMLGRNDANLPHVIRRIEYQRMLKEQIQTVLERLHSNEYETISQYLTDSYTDAFVGTMYTLHQQDVPLILPIDQSVVMKAVTLDSELKESLYKTTGKDMTALKNAVAAEITRGIATGLQYSDIARNIKNAANIPLGRAKTIARTEAGRVQEQATFDAATEAKAHGADVVKQWSSMRDGKTRDTHRMLDGQIREVNEAFTVNGKKAMHPHGFGVAALDINCRCTMLTRARAALDEDTLKLLEERAQQHGLLAKDSKKLGKAQAKNISQFKEKYLKAAETIENTGKSGIMDMDEKTAFNSISDDLPERSSQVDQLLNHHSTRATKWSGKTIVKQPNEMPNAMGAKEWSCDVTLRADSGIKTAVHEHLHARSCSYYAPDVYRKWQRAEEGAVELYAQEICKKNGVSYRESYGAVVKQLRIANSIMKEFDSEYDFAKAFFEVDLPDRYDWLRKRADKVIAEGKLSQKTVMSLNIAVNSLYGKV